MRCVDLNCDLGEGAGCDAVLMPLITSANIACGAHAGDEAEMRATLRLAKRHGVAAGAHPGFGDRANFGRSELPVMPEEVHALVLAQVRRLQLLAAEEDMRLAHVKLHGALYNQVARNTLLAAAAAQAIYEADPRFVFFTLAGSASVRAARDAGLIVAEEVFADRTYQADGTLTPRSQPGALIADGATAVAQVQRMVMEGLVRATDATDVAIRADTVCVHGDGALAVGFAQALRGALVAAGVEVRRFQA